jgi:hypothetical protein
MPASSSPRPSSPPLALAFLALADDAEPPAQRRPAPGFALASVLATAVLALSAPMAWFAAPAPKPSDQPAATPAAKAAVPAPDDDGGDGGV